MATRKKKAATRRPPRRKVKLKYPIPPGAGPFGADGSDPKDSERLSELRSIIDDKIGWDNELQRDRGDYAARLREVAELLDGFGVERVT